jgi:putative transposase
MSNHIHLLLTPNEQDAVSKVMMHLGRSYVQFFNAKYKRTGPLWEGRHKASLIFDEQYLLSCYRYIEMNPVKAKMVPIPNQYPWSSVHFNAYSRQDDLITPHEIFLKLQTKNLTAQEVYKQEILNRQVKERDQTITDALSRNKPIGESL